MTADTKKADRNSRDDKEYIIDEISEEAVEPYQDTVRENPEAAYDQHVRPDGPRRPMPILTDRDANTDREKYRSSDDD